MVGRTRGPQWEHFDELTETGRKTKRAKCKHCDRTVSAQSHTMKTHLSNCNQVPRTIGRLQPGAVLDGSDRQRTQSILELLKAKVFPAVTTAEKAACDDLFSAAVHRNAVPFDLFESEAFRNLFDTISPFWSPPTAAELSTTLLDKQYIQCMGDAFRAIGGAPAVVVGIDGATNVLSRSLSNVIAHDPRPWFIEYLRADLNKESAVNVAKKVAGAIARLHQVVGRDVVYGFISDSCNVMRLLRAELVEGGVVTHAYGCAAHSLNNLCHDLAQTELVKEVLRQALFVSKTIKNQGLMNKIFTSLCIQHLGKPYAMVLYSSTRWSSINGMFTRIDAVRPAIAGMPAAVEFERHDRGIDEEFEIPPAFLSVVRSRSRSGPSDFWHGVSRSVALFDPIC